MNGYYDEDELSNLGLKSYGKNVLISKKASLYGNIIIGNNVRIDDFCVLVGNITLGNYIHLSPFVSLHGTAGGSVTLKDFSSMSSYATIYACSDLYNSGKLTNSMVPREMQELKISDIVLEKHAMVGIRGVLLPGAYLAEGSCLGAMSLLYHKTEPWSIYIGNPAVKKHDRNKGVLEQEKILISQIEDNLL